MNRKLTGSYHVTFESNVPVVTLKGDFGSLELAANPSLVAQIDNAIDAHRRRGVVVEMARLSFGGAGLLAVLIELRKLVTPHGGKVVLAAAPEWLRKFLAATRLDSRLETYPSLPDAVKSLPP